MLDPSSLSTRVSASFAEPSSAATDLNTVSDELGRSVAQIDEALKRLNLGVTVWVPFSRWGDQRDPELLFSDELGYAKITGRWGVSLRRVEGTDAQPEKDVEEWLFNDAPRSLRLAAIEKIPDLLEKLNKEAVRAAALVKARLSDLKAVASVMNQQRTVVDVFDEVLAKHTREVQAHLETMTLGTRTLLSEEQKARVKSK